MNQTAVITPRGDRQRRAGIIFPAPSAETAAFAGDVTALASPRAISLSWLNRVLQRASPGVSALADFSQRPVSTSDFEITVRLQLEYRGRRHGPASVLAKFSRPLPAPKWREFVRQSFRREAAAYCELNRHYACRVPDLLFAVASGGSFNMLLADTGAAPVEPAASVDVHRPEHEAFLQELAQLHGCFVRTSPASAPGWQLRQRDSARFVAHRYAQGVETLRGVFAGRLSRGHFRLLERFSARVATWHRFERHLLTLTHGDARLENGLFLRRENAGCNASLVGWKLAGLRNPMYDVASLLANDLSYTARNNSESALIQRYCRIFEQSGIQYPLREAFRDYQFNLFGPLIFNVCAAAFLGYRLTGNGELIKRIRRNCLALVDWESEKLLGERSNVIA
ncbi:phosphotransferase [Microbulbifer litoralis]|uniref:phosphotransferase n=1 Tax=Microbulbifer litoralis TaxID=2933965 RepID=UPI0020287102|nr:phosphotransferase [Microbulbifer sp. GX H0434]